MVPEILVATLIGMVVEIPVWTLVGMVAEKAAVNISYYADIMTHAQIWVLCQIVCWQNTGLGTDELADTLLTVQCMRYKLQANQHMWFGKFLWQHF